MAKRKTRNIYAFVKLSVIVGLTFLALVELSNNARADGEPVPPVTTDERDMTPIEELGGK